MFKSDISVIIFQIAWRLQTLKCNGRIITIQINFSVCVLIDFVSNFCSIQIEFKTKVWQSWNIKLWISPIFSKCKIAVTLPNLNSCRPTSFWNRKGCCQIINLQIVISHFCKFFYWKCCWITCKINSFIQSMSHNRNVHSNAIFKYFWKQINIAISFRCFKYCRAVPINRNFVSINVFRILNLYKISCASSKSCLVFIIFIISKFYCTILQFFCDIEHFLQTILWRNKFIHICCCRINFWIEISHSFKNITCILKFMFWLCQTSSFDVDVWLIWVKNIFVNNIKFKFISICVFHFAPCVSLVNRVSTMSCFWCREQCQSFDNWRRDCQTIIACFCYNLKSKHIFIFKVLSTKQIFNLSSKCYFCSAVRNFYIIQRRFNFFKSLTTIIIQFIACCIFYCFKCKNWFFILIWMFYFFAFFFRKLCKFNNLNFVTLVSIDCKNCISTDCICLLFWSIYCRNIKYSALQKFQFKIFFWLSYIQSFKHIIIFNPTNQSCCINKSPCCSNFGIKNCSIKSVISKSSDVQFWHFVNFAKVCYITLIKISICVFCYDFCLINTTSKSCQISKNNIIATTICQNNSLIWSCISQRNFKIFSIILGLNFNLSTSILRKFIASNWRIEFYNGKFFTFLHHFLSAYVIHKNRNFMFATFQRIECWRQIFWSCRLNAVNHNPINTHSVSCSSDCTPSQISIFRIPCQIFFFQLVHVSKIKSLNAR